MPWCVKAADGSLWSHAVSATRGGAIDHFLDVYRGDPPGMPRLARWNHWKRQLGVSVVPVLAQTSVWETGRVRDDVRLALAVLRGDRQAALALADLVLEHYRAGRPA